MFERTHGSITRTILLATGWDWQDAQIAGIASMATDHCTPSFIGETHLAEFPALGMPVPTSLNIDPRKTPEQIGSTWYPGWPILARWHGGKLAHRLSRPIQIGDHDIAVSCATPLPTETVTRYMVIRLGMELHAALDTATHCGFWPCWHPQNRNPEYRKSWWRVWTQAIPPILHAQYLSSVDAIEGEGRGGRTRGKVLAESLALAKILKRGNPPVAWWSDMVFELTRATDDSDLCARLDALACEIAGRTLPPLAVWPRGNGAWKEFFAIARGE